MRRTIAGAMCIAVAAFALSVRAAPSGVGPAPRNASTPSTAPIGYHGGPVVLGTARVYLIFYGNWYLGNDAELVEDWVDNVGGTAYWEINTTYYDGSARHVANSVALGGVFYDEYSQGTALDASRVYSIVQAYDQLDPGGIYVVLSSADVTQAGFCTDFCGWHSWRAPLWFIGGLVYAWIGNPATQCPGSCAAQAPSPNGNVGADAVISLLAHEISEILTDPYGTAWYDASNNEGADKCAWNFGSTWFTANGSTANLRLPSSLYPSPTNPNPTRDYLVQRLWVNGPYGGYCGISESDCPAGQAVCGPFCQPCCPGGQTFCPGVLGGCADLSSERYNCGACGRVCPASRPICENGRCMNPYL